MGRSPGARRSAWEGGGSKEGIKDKGRRGKAGGGKEKLEEERKEERRKRREKEEKKRREKEEKWIMDCQNFQFTFTEFQFTTTGFQFTSELQFTSITRISVYITIISVYNLRFQFTSP